MRSVDAVVDQQQTRGCGLGRTAERLELLPSCPRRQIVRLAHPDLDMVLSYQLCISCMCVCALLAGAQTRFYSVRAHACMRSRLRDGRERYRARREKAHGLGVPCLIDEAQSPGPRRIEHLSLLGEIKRGPTAREVLAMLTCLGGGRERHVGDLSGEMFAERREVAVHITRSASPGVNMPSRMAHVCDSGCTCKLACWSHAPAHTRTRGRRVSWSQAEQSRASAGAIASIHHP